MKLSIITVHLNDFEGLLCTFNSLKDVLTTRGIDWIVVDGESAQTSATQSLLEQVKSAAVMFISEPDEGIYDAMNKGTRLAAGDFILYLNAGDELHPDFSLDSLHEIMAFNDVAMLWGRADVRDRTGSVYPRKTRKPFWLRYGMAVSHQAVLFRREMLGNDPYDADLKIAADYNLICGLYTSGAQILTIDTPLCIFDLVGKSSQNRRETLKEESHVRRKHFGFNVATDRIIMEFKGLVWGLGTVLPAFRRAWSKFF